MKTIDAGLQTLLDSGVFVMADLFTITLIDATVLRYTNFDVDIEYGGNTYLSSGLLIERGKVTWKIGLSVDSLELTITPQATGLINGKGFLTALKDGDLDGAVVSLDRAFMVIDTNVPTGIVNIFSGRIAGMEADRLQASITVNSHLELLNINIPRNVYESSCIYQLYSSGCGVVKASYTDSETVTEDEGAGVPTVNRIPTSASTPETHYRNGTITFASGDNNGITRTIKESDGQTVWVVVPLPHVPVAGDAIELTAGCDKTTGTCTARFDNLDNYRGFPYIPTVENAA